MVNYMHSLAETASYQCSSPVFEVKEDSSGYLLSGKMPDMEPKDIAIEFSDGYHVTIIGRAAYSEEEGQRPNINQGREESEVDFTSFWLSRQRTRELSRSFSIPSRIDQHRVEARLESGVLIVVLPTL